MQRILYNVTGQSLVWDCPEGRPSSVTSVSVFPVDVGDDGTAESATTGSASVESNPATTFDANSGVSSLDNQICYLAATTGISVGRRYWAENAAGEHELVEVVGVTSGESVQVRHPLKNDYVSGDAFESTRISISIDSTWVADSTNIGDDIDPNPEYRIRWEYVVDSVTYVHDDYFTLVRYRAEHSVTAQSIDERDAGWINRLPIEHREDRGARLIDKAYSTLGMDLHRRGIPQEMLRNRDVVNELTELKTILMTESARAKATGDVVGYEIARDEYFGALDGLVTNGKTDVAVDESGASSKISAVSLWQK